MAQTLTSSQQQITTSRRTFSPIVLAITLTLIGAGSFSLYHWARDLHRFIQGISGYTALFIGQLAIYLLACFFATRKLTPTTRNLNLLLASIVLIFAAMFRFDLVAQKPYLSTDVYRYVWDGRVQAAGINPYLYAPSAPELAALRDDKIYPFINRSDFVRTPYPPVAQMIFFAAYKIEASNVTGFKTLMAIFDLLAILALMLTLMRAKLSPVLAIIFAWHPLLIYEGAHTGHIDSGFIVFLALAMLAWSYQKPALTGIAIALATMVKFYPALLLPAFFYAQFSSSTIPLAKASLIKKLNVALLNKANLKMLTAFVVTVILVYLPYLNVGVKAFGSLSNEASEEGFIGNGSRYFLLVLVRKIMPLPTAIFLIIAAALLIWLVIKIALTNKRDVMDVVRAAVSLIGLYFFLVTPRYAWYYAWILPFLCFAPRVSWLYLTGASVLLYCLWFTPLFYPGVPIWLGLAVYAPTFGFWLWEKWQAKNA
ncbi:MAG: glycosyltransferase 87 family protein [Acidobacteriota bacterium]